MIRDQITDNIKNKFIEAMVDTIINGRERGFLLCSDGVLTTEKECI